MLYVAQFLHFVAFVVIVDAVLSWVQPDTSKLPRSLTATITAPLYAPIRRVLDPGQTGGLDLSPLILILILEGIAKLLLSFVL